MADFFVNFRTVGAEQAAQQTRALKDRLAEAARENERFTRDMNRRVVAVKEETRELARNRAAAGVGVAGGGARGPSGLAVAARAGGLGRVGTVLGGATPGLMALGGVAFAAAGLVRLFSTGLANAERNLGAFETKLITLRTVAEDTARAQGASGLATVRSVGQETRRIALGGNQSLTDLAAQSPQLRSAIAAAMGTRSTDDILKAAQAARAAGATGLVDQKTAFDAALKSRQFGTDDESIARLVRRTGQRQVTAGDVGSAVESGLSGGATNALTGILMRLDELDATKIAEQLKAGTGFAGSAAVSQELFAVMNPVVAAQEASIKTMERNTAALEAAAAAETETRKVFRDSMAIVANVLTVGTGEFDGSRASVLARERQQIAQVAATVQGTD